MADRYENIRKALAMGPTPVKPSFFGYRPLEFNYSEVSLSRAQDALVTACGPDTIRALLAERDTLEELLLAYMQAINKIDDRAEYILPMPSETRSELHAILAALTAKLAAIAAANGGGNG